MTNTGGSAIVAATDAATARTAIAKARIAIAVNENTLTATELAAETASVDRAEALTNVLYGSAATATGKMKQYSEVNATASASVATDMGWTLTAAISVDAGTATTLLTTTHSTVRKQTVLVWTA